MFTVWGWPRGSRLWILWSSCSGLPANNLLSCSGAWHVFPNAMSKHLNRVVLDEILATECSFKFVSIKHQIHMQPAIDHRNKTRSMSLLFTFAFHGAVWFRLVLRFLGESCSLVPREQERPWWPRLLQARSLLLTDRLNHWPWICCWNRMAGEQQMQKWGHV